MLNDVSISAASSMHTIICTHSTFCPLSLRTGPTLGGGVIWNFSSGLKWVRSSASGHIFDLIFTVTQFGNGQVGHFVIITLYQFICVSYIMIFTFKYLLFQTSNQHNYENTYLFMNNINIIYFQVLAFI